METLSPHGCQTDQNHPPVLHSVGFPALGQLQSTDGRFASRGNVVIAGVSVEVATKATNLVLKPLAHGDAEGAEVVVPDLDVLRCVDDDESLGRGQTRHLTSKKGNRHRCPVNLRRTHGSINNQLRFGSIFLEDVKSNQLNPGIQEHEGIMGAISVCSSDT